MTADGTHGDDARHGDDDVRDRSRRERFRAWRRGRPFAGGVLLMLAGLLIAYVPMQFAFELLLVGGSYTFIGLFWAIGVFLTGAFVLYRPEFSTIFGVLGVVLSLLSLLGALGGLFLGMIIGIVGGNLCVAWSPPAGTAERRESAQGGDGKPVRTDGGDESVRSDGAEAGDTGDDRPKILTDGGEPSDARRAPSDVRSDGDRTIDGDDLEASGGDDEDDDGGIAAAAKAAAAGSLSRARSALSDVVSPREAELAAAVAADLSGRARDGRELAADLASRPPREILRALRRSAVGLAGAARPGRSSRRLAVALALVVVAGGTLSVVGTLPATAVFGDDDRTTYTVDAGEIRLDEGGQVCAASVGGDTYRVTITDATLVDATVYQQQDGEAVKADFPRLSVDDTIVMYTESDDEDFELLATTLGCTDEDQTSRTVFRNSYQESSKLLGPEGVTMLNMQIADGGVPEPGGFQFVAPGENGSSPTNVTGEVESIADDIDDVLNGTLEDRLENTTGDVVDVNGTVDGVNETVGNATDGQVGVDTVENATANATDATEETVSTVGGTAANTTEDTVANTTREVAGDDPPENVSGTVDGTTDAVDTTTGEVANTTDDVTDATDEVANATGDETASTVVDDTTDAVDGTTEGVDDTTDEVTDGVDETTEQAVRPVEETATPEATETTEATPTPTEVPITPTEVLTPTPEDEEPDWLDGVDEDNRTSVLETVEETDGGLDDVENVTDETQDHPEEAIEGDENLTRLENGTVLLLNGTDPGLIDWDLEDPLDTVLTSTEDSETEAREVSDDGDPGDGDSEDAGDAEESTSDGDSGTETDDGDDTEESTETDDGDGTLFG